MTREIPAKTGAIRVIFEVPVILKGTNNGRFHMKTAGVIGLGDMGSGLAKNLMKNGFAVRGFDLDESR